MGAKLGIATSIIGMATVAQTPLEPDWLKGGALAVLAGLLVLMLWKVLPTMHSEQQKAIMHAHDSQKEVVDKVCTTFRECTNEIKSGQDAIEVAIRDGNKQQISLLSTLVTNKSEK